MKSRMIRVASIALLAVSGSSAAVAEELWTVTGGSTQILLDAETLARANLTIEKVGGPRAATQQGSLVFDINPDSSLTFSLVRGSVKDFVGGSISHFADLRIASADRQVVLEGLSLLEVFGAKFEGRWTLDSAAGTGGLVLGRYKAGFDVSTLTMMMHSPELMISPELASSLGRKDLAGRVIGTVTIKTDVVWEEGTTPDDLPDDRQPPPGGGPRSVGPDMVFCQLYGLNQAGRAGSMTGLSIATTSWNIGDAVLPWYSSPAEEHPFIVMNMYRLKTVAGSERFEQIGQSSVKHGFCAVDSSQCTTSCTGTGCSTLGLGCTDTYGASLNASQGGLAPRYEVNPWTRGWVYATSEFATGGPPLDGATHRLQVHDDDLDAAQNAGATYYGEGLYICPQDVNVMNSVAWKTTTVTGAPGGTWSFGMSGSGTMATAGFTIDAWVGATQTVLAQQVPVIEYSLPSPSPDGRCVLAAKATDIGGGMWHYEYALLNVDMDRQGSSFSVPLPAGITVANVGFHAVLHHDEAVNGVGGTPIDNAVWTPTVTGTDITWATTTNPLRWGTMYNFRFDGDSGPGDVTATLGMFKPGTPSSVSGTTVGPAGPPAVCGDLVVEGVEECDPPGSGCDVDCTWICGDAIAHPPLEPCDSGGVDTAGCDADCTLVECGDFHTNVAAGEDCDDGGVDTGACDDDCSAVLCGDGHVNTAAGEMCDDGNTTPGDGCDALCQREQVCGDGFIDPPEQCDDGNTTPGDGCDASCQSESNDDCVAAIAIGEGTVATDTTAATTDGPTHAGCQYDGQTYNDIWYQHTATCDGTLTVSFCTEEGGDAFYDTDLVVYDGCDCQNLVMLACNDDASGCTASGTSWPSRVVVPVTAFNCYLIRVGGYASGSRGTATLSVSNSGSPCGGPYCGDGNVDPGEECDDGNTTPGDGCDATCHVEITDCNANGRADDQDIACGGGQNCGGLDGSYDCNGNGIPDECELPGDLKAYEVDVIPALAIPDNNPVGVSHAFTVPDNGIIDDVDVDLLITHTYVSDLCVTLEHNGTTVSLIQRAGVVDPRGPCHVGSPYGCAGNNYDIILDDEGTGGAIEDLCGTPTVPTSPPNYTPFAALSAFDGMDKVGDWIITIVDNAGGDIGTLDHWSLHITNQGGGAATPCGDAIRGGLIYDQWWTVVSATEPVTDHPLWSRQSSNTRTGSATWRCKECHGWDYKGAAGAYGSGSHYTGFGGVFGSTLTAQQMFDLLKNPESIADPDGHGYGAGGMSDGDIWDAVQFLQDLLIDTDTYINAPTKVFLGDPVQGQIDYNAAPPTGGTACAVCHGADGTNIDFDPGPAAEFVGTIAVQNPWELLHKIRIGQPGAPMPGYLVYGGTDQGATDIGRYAQLNFPVECTTSGHCDDGDPCTTDSCDGSGNCQHTPIGPPDGDMNGIDGTNGDDIQLFVDAILNGATLQEQCHGDFDGVNSVDVGDIPDMVNALLTN